MATRHDKVQLASNSKQDSGTVAGALLTWYDRHRRDLPWRSRPGEHADPYAIWLSEIMLQQTTVVAVRSYYLRFLARWPTVAALADAPLSAVLEEWAGLGYYSRARNLHACATVVASTLGGRFPETEAALRKLPGIGVYTAAAIAAIAFDRRAVVVDGNVERVMARLFAVSMPLPAAKPLIREAMDSVTPDLRAGDFAQAVMDLGATICTPKAPACILCPLMALCRAAQTGEPARFPVKPQRSPVPQREGAVFLVRSSGGSLLVKSRPTRGLFGGMTDFPGTEWSLAFDLASVTPPPGIQKVGSKIGVVEHGLTHFTLRLHVFEAEACSIQPPDHRWIDASQVEREAFPTLMRKVLALGRPTRG